MNTREAPGFLWDDHSLPSAARHMMRLVSQHHAGMIGCPLFIACYNEAMRRTQCVAYDSLPYLSCNGSGLENLPDACSLLALTPRNERQRISCKVFLTGVCSPYRICIALSMSNSISWPISWLQTRAVYSIV